MSQPYVIAGDLGTSGVKIVLVSMEGSILATATEQYALYTNASNHAEQEPEEYWQAVCRATARVRSNQWAAEDCAGIAFGTQWKGIIPIDADGKVLRRSIIWMDKRAIEEAKELNEAMGEPLFCESDYWPKLLWFRKHEPELYERSVHILEANSFLKWKATGVMVSDITNCYTRAYSASKQAFYDKVLACAGLDPEKFPPLCTSTDLVGHLTAEAAAQLQLLEGTPVFGGCCDIPGLAIGSGCAGPGAVHTYFGTSAWVGAITPHDPSVVYCPPLDKEHDVSFYGLGISVGPSTQWVVDTLFAEEKARYSTRLWPELDKLVAETAPGADRLLAAPWFFGARPPLAGGNARGLFLNLSSQHTRAHMLRALLESYCYIVRQNIEKLNAVRETPLPAITACGGGTNNPHWMQALADILKIEVRIPEDASSTGAVGVAYCALIGLGVVPDFASLADQVHIRAIYRPRPEYFAEYDLLYSQFIRLYPILSDLFTQLNL